MGQLKVGPALTRAESGGDYAREHGNADSGEWNREERAKEGERLGKGLESSGSGSIRTPYRRTTA
jgi:hypothetical protein